MRAALGETLEEDSEGREDVLAMLTEVFGLIEHALARSNSGR